jgi:hypothetical protein
MQMEQWLKKISLAAVGLAAFPRQHDRSSVHHDHLFMGDANNSFSVVNPIVAGAINRVSQDVDMVTERFNYRFGPLVAARY